MCAFCSSQRTGEVFQRFLVMELIWYKIMWDLKTGWCVLNLRKEGMWKVWRKCTVFFKSEFIFLVELKLIKFEELYKY